MPHKIHYNEGTGVANSSWFDGPDVTLFTHTNAPLHTVQPTTKHCVKLKEQAHTG